jgi:GNAT superfamily N-acetyltransferase
LQPEPSVIEVILSHGAFEGDRLVGLTFVGLVVRKEFRRQGVASNLLNALMADLPAGVDIVKIDNIDRSDTSMLAFF